MSRLQEVQWFRRLACKESVREGQGRGDPNIFLNE